MGAKLIGMKTPSLKIEKVKSQRIIERIKYLSDEMTLISENKRINKAESEEEE